MLYQLSYSRNYEVPNFHSGLTDAIFNVSCNLVEIAVFSGLNVLFSAFENSVANIYYFFFLQKATCTFVQFFGFYFLNGRSKPVIFLISLSLFSASSGVS